MATTGDLLRQLRSEKKLTQEQVARACDIALISYVRYESGGRVPSSAIAEKLCKFFGITMDELFAGKKGPDEISDEDLRFALFGETAKEITKEDFDDVKKYARFVLARKRGQLE